MISFLGKEQQDEFAYLLLGNKSTFLDVGCYHPLQWNNTFSLERLGWTGLMIDIEDKWVNLCNSNRLNQAYLCDITKKENFIGILENHWPEKHFGYISMDADTGNVKGLSNYLESGYSFDVMTYEHDSYQCGDERKAPSKEILESYGYFLLFEDMTCTDDNLVWEDWWINPRKFNQHIMSLRSKNIHHNKAIQIIKEHIANNGII